MRNKFVYSCSVKICASRFDKFLESICCFLLSMEAFFLQNLVEILEEVVVSWQEVGWMWWMRQNFIAQFVQALTVRHAVGCFLEENWALSLDQCWLQLQLLVHLIDFLSILLRCNGFTGIQKAVVDQTGSRPQVTRNFFGRQVELWGEPQGLRGLVGCHLWRGTGSASTEPLSSCSSSSSSSA